MPHRRGGEDTKDNTNVTLVFNSDIPLHTQGGETLDQQLEPDLERRFLHLSFGQQEDLMLNPTSPAAPVPTIIILPASTSATEHLTITYTRGPTTNNMALPTPPADINQGITCCHCRRLIRDGAVACCVECPGPYHLACYRRHWAHGECLMWPRIGHNGPGGGDPPVPTSGSNGSAGLQGLPDTPPMTTPMVILFSMPRSAQQ